MRRCINILLLMLLATTGIAQETHVVDSLQDVLATQEGREKVKTMMELTWEFYDISFDDCIAWGEKAIKEANALGYDDLEAKANYVVGSLSFPFLLLSHITLSTTGQGSMVE